MLPGNPSIYYGDETALQGYKDPYNRSTFPWNNTRDDISNLISELTGIRNRHEAFKYGFISCEVSNEDILKFSTEYTQFKYTVIINRSKEKSYNMDGITGETIYALNAGVTGSQANILPLGAIIFTES